MSDKQYIKYTNRGGNWPPNYDTLDPISELNKVKADAHRAAYDLLTTIDKTNKKLQIATAESLTAGLIFSTLVDIPFGGSYKYGCFGVYDTDAKRVFLGVKVLDVYTHKCAQEMAVGVLKNSNASIAIAVSGNAMPHPSHVDQVGEVFISIAGYKQTLDTNEYEIIVSTNVYNFCIGNSTCELWHKTPYEENNLRKLLQKNNVISANIISSRLTDGYNDFQITSLTSQFIRNATTKQALTDCINFIQNNDPIVPTFIEENRIEVNGKIDPSRSHKIGNISNNKTLTAIQSPLNIKCISTNCNDEERKIPHKTQYLYNEK